MDTDQLFGNGDMKLATELSRSIQGSDPHNVKLYVESMWHYLEGQRYCQKQAELLQAEKLNVKNAERVDEIIIDASLYAESKCKRWNQVWWSLLLVQAKFTLNTLKSQLSMIQ
eukprot:3421909-Ditylum_brightwellii.AAC.1